MEREKLGFDENDAKRILQRAAALDARIVGRLSVDEIRSVAREAGISETAISVALAEANEASDPPPSRISAVTRKIGFRTRALAMLAGLFGFASGASAAPHAFQPYSQDHLITVAGVLLAISVAGAARAIKRDRFSAYRIMNGVMWIGFGVGFMMVRGAPEDIATTAGAGWAISTGISALLMAIKMYLSSPTAPPGKVNAAAGT